MVVSRMVGLSAQAVTSLTKRYYGLSVSCLAGSQVVKMVALSASAIPCQSISGWYQTVCITKDDRTMNKKVIEDPVYRNHLVGKE